VQGQKDAEDLRHEVHCLRKLRGHQSVITLKHAAEDEKVSACCVRCWVQSALLPPGDGIRLWDFRFGVCAVKSTWLTCFTALFIMRGMAMRGILIACCGVQSVHLVMELCGGGPVRPHQNAGPRPRGLCGPHRALSHGGPPGVPCPGHHPQGHQAGERAAHGPRPRLPHCEAHRLWDRSALPPR